LENKLKNLYALQHLDRQLDELEELKGDLPHEIRSLEATRDDLKEKHATLELTMRTSFSEREHDDNEILQLKEKVERYKTQQTKVRNNREYDALTKEMDHAIESISKLEKQMESLETKATVARNELEVVAKQLEEIEGQLKVKYDDLAEISKTTIDEETQLRKDRAKALRQVAPPDVAQYERIRKARNGIAIVPVKRNACGGCFNRVPPQTILELKQNNRLYTCERCGRILVSDEIVESVTAKS
jgi:uncharacterized protein